MRHDRRGHGRKVGLQRRGRSLLLAAGLALGACAPGAADGAGRRAAAPGGTGDPSLPAPWHVAPGSSGPDELRAAGFRTGTGGAWGSLVVEVGGGLEALPGGTRPSAGLRVFARAGRSGGWISLEMGSGGWPQGGNALAPSAPAAVSHP